jgi:hypothetical protein
MFQRLILSFILKLAPFSRPALRESITKFTHCATQEVFWLSLSHSLLFYPAAIGIIHEGGINIKVIYMPNIIGREAEQKVLALAYQSDHTEFIAVYGRRRVGKTYS